MLEDSRRQQHQQTLRACAAGSQRVLVSLSEVWDLAAVFQSRLLTRDAPTVCQLHPGDVKCLRRALLQLGSIQRACTEVCVEVFGLRRRVWDVGMWGGGGGGVANEPFGHTV